MSANYPLIAMRPLSIGQIIDTSLRLYRRNFWSFLAIVALLQLPLLVLSMLASAAQLSFLTAVLGDPLSSDQFIAPWSSLLQNGNSIVTALLSYFINAALTVAVAGALFGEEVTLRGAYQAVRGRFVDILIFAVLGLVLSFSMVFVAALGALTCVGLFIGIGGLLTINVVLQLAIPVMMLEGRGAWESIVRAWNLMRRRYWPAFWTNITAALFQLSALAGIQSVVLVVAALVYIDQFQGSLDDLPVNGIVVSVLAVAIIGLFAAPVSIGVVTILYFDLRVRQDGVDLALASLPVNAAESVLTRIRRTPVSPNDQQLVRRQDLKPLFLLGLLPIGIIVALWALIFLLAAVAALSINGA